MKVCQVAAGGPTLWATTSRLAPIVRVCWHAGASSSSWHPARSPRARRTRGAAQWLANTTIRGVAADDRKRHDFVVYGATPTREALCCNARRVSRFTRAEQVSPVRVGQSGWHSDKGCGRPGAMPRGTATSVRLGKRGRRPMVGGFPTVPSNASFAYAADARLSPCACPQCKVEHGPCPLCQQMRMTSRLLPYSNSRTRRLPVSCLREIDC